MPTILITGGNGRTAHQLIEEFLSHPNCPKLRVLVRTDEDIPLRQAYPLLTHPPHTIIVADQMNDRILTSASHNVTVVVHDGPSMHQQETFNSISIIDAAKHAGVKHFVLCSVLHPIRSKLLNHTIKLQVEEHLIESRLNYTILQMTNFMQNVSLNHVLTTGRLQLPYSRTVEQGFVDMRDCAHVLRTVVLNMESHIFATYELVSENMTYTKVAETLQELMHRRVECEVIPRKTYVEMMRASDGVESEWVEDAIERIILYNDRWGLTGNSNVLRWLLGHEPRKWRGYATEMLLTIHPGDLDALAL